MRFRKFSTTVLFVVIVFLAASAIYASLPHSSVSSVRAEEVAVEQAPPEPAAAQPLPLLMGNPYLIADIAEVASPATVFLAVEWPAPETPNRGMFPRYRDPFGFFDFFIDPWFFYTEPQRQTSQGTGFFIDESGIILTNQHVVGNKGEGQTIKVALDVPGLKEEYYAEIIGADATLDLAVLRIIDAEEDTLFPYLELGDSDAAGPGEWVIAIGNPYGQAFDHTVTIGVLSAKGRAISVRGSDGRIQRYENLMQTDASINPGNSGGPLLNIEGKVIGINTAVHATAQGIGFAIPINVAKDVLEELIETGGVKHELPPRPWIGIYYREITEDLAKQLRLPDSKGVIVVDVISGSPAEAAGLRSLDIIRRVNDRDIFTLDDMKEALTGLKPGDEILVTVYRGGTADLISITLGNMPAELRTEE
ncbi:MAG: PDZ domain-containing protein [Firmicutes bacterium]|nr:PDZ domain-containing protein [Bacillota bacterium]